uniref:Uncharacterized protein n=1 Tax=Picea glauca TaxID=3330 RepID=A0A117NFG5_PICGL|nr:hypothetical protein ABT39_MTgene3588 [Picea glauca]
MFVNCPRIEDKALASPMVGGWQQGLTRLPNEGSIGTPRCVIIH